MTQILKVENLGITFGGLKAVQGVNLSVNQGEIIGLIGPNGAGKTTVFNMLTNVYQPTTGSIELEGRSIVGKKTYETTGMGIARTFQNIRLFKSQTVFENILIAKHLRRTSNLFTATFHLNGKEEAKMRKEAEELLRIVGLEDLRDEMATSLPYGKQRKLEIARALATEPKLLLLDEPAAGMNPNETAELMDTIRFVRDNFNMTVLLIEHDMKLVSGICEKLTVLNFGQVLREGATSDVLHDPEVIKAYLGE